MQSDWSLLSTILLWSLHLSNEKFLVEQTLRYVLNRKVSSTVIIDSCHESWISLLLTAEFQPEIKLSLMRNLLEYNKTRNATWMLYSLNVFDKLPEDHKRNKLPYQEVVLSRFIKIDKIAPNTTDLKHS